MLKCEYRRSFRERGILFDCLGGFNTGDYLSNRNLILGEFVIAVCGDPDFA